MYVAAPGATRNANSPRESDTDWSFLSFLGASFTVSVTAAPGRENPFSRNTVPATTACGASFLSAAPSRSAQPHSTATSLLLLALTSSLLPPHRRPRLHRPHLRPDRPHPD